MTWLLAALAVLLLVLVWYACWTARRLDRLHRRLDAAASAFDEQLGRRARAAIGCDIESLNHAGRGAIALLTHLDHEREVVENALSATISTALAGKIIGVGSPEAALLDQATRSAFARRFYNDAVRDVLHVRDRRVVRWGHLAGRAPRPPYMEIDDGILPRVQQGPVDMPDTIDLPSEPQPIN